VAVVAAVAVAVVVAVAETTVALFGIITHTFALLQSAIRSVSGKVPTLHPGLTKLVSEASRWL
jgi:hypothetical protein